MTALWAQRSNRCNERPAAWRHTLARVGQQFARLVGPQVVDIDDLVEECGVASDGCVEKVHAVSALPKQTYAAPANSIRPRVLQLLIADFSRGCQMTTALGDAGQVNPLPAHWRVRTDANTRDIASFLELACCQATTLDGWCSEGIWSAPNDRRPTEGARRESQTD